MTTPLSIWCRARRVNLRVIAEDEGDFPQDLVVRDFVDVVEHQAWRASDA